MRGSIPIVGHLDGEDSIGGHEGVQPLKEVFVIIEPVEGCVGEDQVDGLRRFPCRDVIDDPCHIWMVIPSPFDHLVR